MIKMRDLLNESHNLKRGKCRVFQNGKIVPGNCSIKDNGSTMGYADKIEISVPNFPRFSESDEFEIEQRGQRCKLKFIEPGIGKGNYWFRVLGK